MHKSNPAGFVSRPSATGAVLIALILSAQPGTLVPSGFDGTTWATVFSGIAGNLSGRGTVPIEDWTNDLSVACLSGLAAIQSTGGRFAPLQAGAATHTGLNNIHISRNLNLAFPCQRGANLVIPTVT